MEVSERSENDKIIMRLRVANGALREGDPSGALRELLVVEKMGGGKFPELHHTRALCYFVKKDLEKAIISAEKAVKLSPNYSDANNTLGKLYVDTGKHKQAELFLKRAADDPLYSSAYKPFTNLGISYYRQNKFKEALFNFDKAIDASPHLACVAYYYKGHLYLKSNENIKAINAYTLATRRYCSNFADAHYALGLAFARNKQYDEARKKFLSIQQLYPNMDISMKAMDQLRGLP